MATRLLAALPIASRCHQASTPSAIPNSAMAAMVRYLPYARGSRGRRGSGGSSRGRCSGRRGRGGGGGSENSNDGGGPCSGGGAHWSSSGCTGCGRRWSYWLSRSWRVSCRRAVLPVEVLRLRWRLARRRRRFERIRLPRHPRRRLGRLPAHRIAEAAHRLVGQRGGILRALARRVVTRAIAIWPAAVRGRPMDRLRGASGARRRWRRRRRRGACAAPPGAAAERAAAVAACAAPRGRGGRIPPRPCGSLLPARAARG